MGDGTKPSSQGLAERSIRTVLQRLKMKLMGKQNWAQQISTILFALRGTPSVRSTMFSPFYIMFGQEMRFPFDLTLPALAIPHLLVPDMTSKEKDNNSLMKHVKVLHPRLDLIRQLARENIIEAQP